MISLIISVIHTTKYLTGSIVLLFRRFDCDKLWSIDECQVIYLFETLVGSDVTSQRLTCIARIEKERIFGAMYCTTTSNDSSSTVLGPC